MWKKGDWMMKLHQFRSGLDREDLAIMAAIRTVCTGIILFGVGMTTQSDLVYWFVGMLVGMDVYIELARKDLRRDERKIREVERSIVRDGLHGGGDEAGDSRGIRWTLF